jgi:hypothetical protein
MTDRPQTIEFFRHVFMDQGFNQMVSEIKKLLQEAGNPISSERLNNWIRAILYGSNPDGTIRTRPPQPDLNDIKNDYSKFKFESKVHQL